MFGYYDLFSSWATQRVGSLWGNWTCLWNATYLLCSRNLKRLLTAAASSTLDDYSQNDGDGGDDEISNTEDVEQPRHEEQHHCSEQALLSSKSHSLPMAISTAHSNPLKIFPHKDFHSIDSQAPILHDSSAIDKNEDELCLGLYLSSDTLAFWIRQLQLVSSSFYSLHRQKQPIRKLLVWDNNRQSMNHERDHHTARTMYPTISQEQKQQSRHLWQLLLDQGLQELQVHGFDQSKAPVHERRVTQMSPTHALLRESWLYHILDEEDEPENATHSSSPSLETVRLFYMNLCEEQHSCPAAILHNDNPVQQKQSMGFLQRIINANPRIHTLYMAYCTLAREEDKTCYLSLQHQDDATKINTLPSSWSNTLQDMPQLQSLTIVHCGVTDVMLDHALSALASSHRKQLFQRQRTHDRTIRRMERRRQPATTTSSSAIPNPQSTTRHGRASSNLHFSLQPSRSLQFIHERGLPSLLDEDDDDYLESSKHQRPDYDEIDENDLIPLNLELHGNLITASSISLLAHMLRQEDSLLQSVTLHANPSMDAVLLHQQERGRHHHAQEVRRRQADTSNVSSFSVPTTRTSASPCPALYHFLEVLQTHHTSLRHFSWHNCTGMCCEACEPVAHDLITWRLHPVWNKWMQILLNEEQEESSLRVNNKEEGGCCTRRIPEQSVKIILDNHKKKKNPLWSHWLRPLAKNPPMLYEVLRKPRVMQALLVNSDHQISDIVPQKDRTTVAATTTTTTSLLEKKIL